MTSLLALGADQCAKTYVASALEVGARRPLVDDRLSLTHVPSWGGTLGFSGDWLPDTPELGFALVAACATLGIVAFYQRLAPREVSTAAGLGAILGGIASQTADRLRFGSGLDFLHLGSLRSSAAPDVNLADIAILLGVLTLIVELLTEELAARASEGGEH